VAEDTEAGLHLCPHLTRRQSRRLLPIQWSATASPVCIRAAYMPSLFCGADPHCRCDGGLLLARTKQPIARALNNSSIAVLPFADLSPGKDQEYFSDGLTEELINDLAKVLDSKSSHAPQPFSSREKTRICGLWGGSSEWRMSGRQGSKEGNQVRITAELIKADDGFQLWSEPTTARSATSSPRRMK